MDLEEEEGLDTAADIAAAVIVVADILLADIAAAVIVVADILVADIAAAVTVVADILVLIILTLIDLLDQKVGKTEVMQIPLKTLNMKMEGAGEKGEYLMRVMYQTRQISNPFLQAFSLILIDI